MTVDQLRNVPTPVLGPAPCSDCHLPLWWVIPTTAVEVGGIRPQWCDRGWRSANIKTAVLWDTLNRPAPVPVEADMKPVYTVHICTAKAGNPVVYVTPKGRQGRGGYWRRDLLGLPRTRRAPAGRPELI